MKSKMKFLSWMFIASFCIAFTACGDDDDDTDYATTMAGVYVGSVAVPAITVMGVPEQTVENVTINVNYLSKNKVNLSMALLQISEGLAVPPVSCECKTSKDGVSGETSVEIPGLGDTPVLVSGPMNNLKITIRVTPPGSPIGVDLPVIYTGQKQK